LGGARTRGGGVFIGHVRVFRWGFGGRKKNSPLGDGEVGPGIRTNTRGGGRKRLREKNIINFLGWSSGRKKR